MRCRFHFLLAAILCAAAASQTQAQIIYEESFETNGDGARYLLLDPGFEIAPDSGPGLWGHNFEMEQIGLQQNAPAKRAAIMWEANLFEDLVADTDALDVWSSLVSWALDGKEEATIGFLGDTLLEGNEVVADRLSADGHTVEEFFLGDEVLDAELDLIIHASDISFLQLTDHPVPLISYRGSDHDDTAIAGLGTAVDFFDPVDLDVTAEGTGHPALGGKEDTISWLNDGGQLQSIGKTHNGGTTLATTIYEDPNTFEEIESAAIFVIEEGDPLLGAFNPDPEGDGYIVGAALNKFGIAGERLLTINPVDVSGADDLQMTVALAATAADFEPGDYLRIEVDPDGGGPEGFQVIEEFWGVNDNLSDCNKGLSNGEIAGEEGDICLQPDEFVDHTFDLPDDATEAVVQFALLSTWGNEIIAIDHLRIHDGELVTVPTGDFNEDGNLDAADLDLLSQGQKDNDAAFDLTGDGMTDLDDRLEWINNFKGTWAGDSNLDGEFNSGDFVVAFTAGKYETGEMAGWAEGDWNGDMMFDSGDFVFAFAEGGYEAGPRAATAAVPEPHALTLLLVGLLGVIRRRGR